MTAQILPLNRGVNLNDIWLTTRSGRLYLNRPEEYDFTIEEIAFCLSNTTRFNGQTSFYSVAEHCVNVLRLVNLWVDLNAHLRPELDYENIYREALLHDAAEAYVGDLVTPLKAALPGFRTIEKRIYGAIKDQLGLEGESKIVHDMDFLAAVLEKESLFKDPEPWDGETEILLAYKDIVLASTEFRIENLSPEDAYSLFLTEAKLIGLIDGHIPT